MIRDVAAAILTTLVVVSALPIASGLYQYGTVALSFFKTHLEHCQDHLPRVAVIVPAWNEGAVIGATIDQLMRLDYPVDRLRIYVVDDGSSDETPRVVIERSKEYRSRVFHIRRVAGGEGKAHTLNYGLNELWRDDWTEAVLIMDADVIYTPTSLRRMARHLADPTVGAVTAYIREGSRAPNWVQRYIAFEYITATAVSRRAQNVLGFLACLSGGAQLHSRANLAAIGGEIFTATLAEDTFTTFKTQLAGRRALFEPNAIVFAEEPDALDMLWKQRVRWARGNVQITRTYKDLWLRRKRHPGLGSVSMAILWFSLFLTPVFQTVASISMLALYAIDPPWSWQVFRGFWIVAGLQYLLVLIASLVVDPWTGRRSWLEGILFPGVVSLAIIVATLVPRLAVAWTNLPATPRCVVTLSAYAWVALAMPVSYVALMCERSARLGRLSRWFLYIGGYGAFLSAVTVGAYIKEARGASMAWDKTVKTGKVS
jgi:cellulose synthase/poly-beta-1,6-N-acetylglucosamine synthase-like glycosyltransferase